jgi:hypothetical protein
MNSLSFIFKGVKKPNLTGGILPIFKRKAITLTRNILFGFTRLFYISS